MNRTALATQYLVRLNRDTTAAFTDQMVNDFLSQAHRWAANYYKWPFPEGRVSTTWSSSTEEYDFEGYQADSFRFVQVGGKRLQKLNFEDYQIFRELRSSGNDKVYSDFGGLVFINPNLATGGTLTAWGKYMPADFDKTDDSTTTTTESVFTEGNDEGNQAVIEEAMNYYFERTGDKTQADYHHKLAVQHLDKLWEKVKAEQPYYHSHRSRDGTWKRIDMLRGGLFDIAENRFF